METREFEAMIQRFCSGDRSLEVLAPLNEAAWDGFHDPWERKPFFLTAGAEGFLGGGLPGGVTDGAEQQGPGPRRPAESRMSPAALAPRLSELVANYMEVQHWDYVREENGEFLCTPPMCGMAGQDLTLRLSGGGIRSRFLWFHMSSGFGIPEEARRRARALCIRWNLSRPHFCARLEMQFLSRGGDRPWTGILAMHNRMPVPPDVTMRTLVAFLDGCRDQASDFWTRARLELLP